MHELNHGKKNVLYSTLLPHYACSALYCEQYSYRMLISVYTYSMLYVRNIPSAPRCYAVLSST